MRLVILRLCSQQHQDESKALQLHLLPFKNIQVEAHFTTIFQQLQPSQAMYSGEHESNTLLGQKKIIQDPYFAFPMARPENIEKGWRTSPLHSPCQCCDMVRLKIQESLGHNKKEGEGWFCSPAAGAFNRERVGMTQMGWDTNPPFCWSVDSEASNSPLCCLDT